MYAVQETPYGVQLSTVSASTTTRKPSGRGQLSRAVVVDRALAVADADGLESVTVRRLATDLDVTPMALYWHFRTKDDLLAGAADRLLDGLALPAGDGPWHQRLHAAITALVEALRPHPQLAPLVADRLLEHPTGLALTELTLGCLAEAGFDTASSAQLAWHALRTAVLLVTDDQVDDSGASASDREAKMRAKTAQLAALPAAEYPHLRAAAEDLIHCGDDEKFYRLGIDHFVAGVRGIAPKGRRRRA